MMQNVFVYREIKDDKHLSVSTLQHWLAHIVCALLFVGTVAILKFSMAFSVCLTNLLHSSKLPY